MSPTLDAFLRSWPSCPWLVLALVLTAALYLRGYYYLHRRAPQRWPLHLPAAFVAGLAAVFLALASPIEPFADLLLQVHMLQHLLLMMAAPPLLWLGAPLFPLLRGLPAPVRIYWVAPLFRSPRLRALLRRWTHPAFALPLFVLTTWLWHVPAVYEIALGSRAWHYLEHGCFLASALLFWYGVVRPYPSRPHWSVWLLLPCLILADVQNTILAALLTFADRVLYPHYAQVPRLAGLSALDDQAAAGVLMWVPGSVVFLLPLFWIGLGLLYGRQLNRQTRSQGIHPTSPARLVGRISLPLVGSTKDSLSRSGFDLLRLPLLGRFLKWRHARLSLQLVTAVLAAVVIADGLWGPAVGPMNLAGVLPWIHWRGFVVLGLLAAGNVACLSCPFLLPRTLARRWLVARRAWPRRLRSKWVAVALLVLWLWAYEAFSLWDSPWWTAWIALGYFVAAFVIDGLFRGASFCKYLCPIGQFNFVQSLVSPLEVRRRDPEVCASCRTKDCIRGREGVPGCELHLFQPRKGGNMDCTFCLDCIHTCPHDNIGIPASFPGRGLWDDSFHSGIGRFARRPDLAALVLVLVFGAFANAAGMVGPVQEWQERLPSLLGTPSRLLATSLYFLVTLLVVPLGAVMTAAVLSRRWGGLRVGWVEVATRYSFALVPLGFAMWLSHGSFHLLTSYDTAVPAAQRFAEDLSWTGLGQPQWTQGCCRAVGDWLTRLEILFLDLGLLFSLYVLQRISQGQSVRPGQALKALAPWAVLAVLLFLAGVWIVLQPMQMRGTLGG